MSIFNNLFSSEKICFLILFFSLLIGFYFNEDASGGGAVVDFYNTWGYNIALQKDLFVDPTQWTLHFPLHHIILSKLNLLIPDQYFLRLFLCITSIAVPLLFYLNLKTKFNSMNKNTLWFLSSLIFILPSFRYSAMWANDHITASIFFLLSTLFFLKWEKKNYDKINLNIILQVIFLTLAVYTRQYYALLFLYFMFVYFQKLNFENFIKLSFIVFVLSLPGFWLISNQYDLLTITFSNKLFNSLLVNSSIMSFYLIPIFFLLIINNKKIVTENFFLFISSALFSILFVYLLSIQFNYNYNIGGGFILKLSILLFDNKLLFYLSSIFGFIFLTYLSLENKNNFVLIILLLFGFSAYMIFQKYFEPTFLFIFFLLLSSKLPHDFLKNYKNLLYLYVYIFVYLVSAIVNDIYKITKDI